MEHRIRKRLAVFLAAVLTVPFFGTAVTGQAAQKAAGTKNVIVVLDPGHGGKDVGAVKESLQEKNLTLSIAEYCREELEQYSGVQVYMTRSDDSYLSPEERAAFASAAGADALVSLHINSGGAITSANGAEVYYPNNNYRPSCGTEGKALAQGILNNLTALGLRNRGVKTYDSQSSSATYPDGSKTDYYAVIRGQNWQDFRE